MNTSQEQRIDKGKGKAKGTEPEDGPRPQSCGASVSSSSSTGVSRPPSSTPTASSEGGSATPRGSSQPHRSTSGGGPKVMAGYEEHLQAGVKEARRVLEEERQRQKAEAEAKAHRRRLEAEERRRLEAEERRRLEAEERRRLEAEERRIKKEKFLATKRQEAEKNNIIDKIKRNMQAASPATSERPIPNSTATSRPQFPPPAMAYGNSSWPSSEGHAPGQPSSFAQNNPTGVSPMAASVPASSTSYPTPAPAQHVLTSMGGPSSGPSVQSAEVVMDEAVDIPTPIPSGGRAMSQDSPSADIQTPAALPDTDAQNSISQATLAHPSATYAPPYTTTTSQHSDYTMEEVSKQDDMDVENMDGGVDQMPMSPTDSGQGGQVGPGVDNGGSLSNSAIDSNDTRENVMDVDVVYPRHVVYGNVQDNPYEGVIGLSRAPVSTRPDSRRPYERVRVERRAVQVSDIKVIRSIWKRTRRSSDRSSQQSTNSGGEQSSTQATTPANSAPTQESTTSTQIDGRIQSSDNKADVGNNTGQTSNDGGRNDARNSASGEQPSRKASVEDEASPAGGDSETSNAQGGNAEERPEKSQEPPIPPLWRDDPRYKHTVPLDWPFHPDAWPFSSIEIKMRMEQWKLMRKQRQRELLEEQKRERAIASQKLMEKQREEGSARKARAQTRATTAQASKDTLKNRESKPTNRPATNRPREQNPDVQSRKDGERDQEPKAKPRCERQRQRQGAERSQSRSGQSQEKGRSPPSPSPSQSSSTFSEDGEPQSPSPDEDEDPFVPGGFDNRPPIKVTWRFGVNALALAFALSIGWHAAQWLAS